MNYRCQINHEGLITLPDMICNDLGIEVGVGNGVFVQKRQKE